jgi:hypothetical protein
MEVRRVTSQLLDRPSTQSDTFTLTPDERLVDRYKRMTLAGTGTMRDEALRTARYELDLPFDERRRRVAQRLRAWLALTSEEARPLMLAVKEAYRQLDIAERLDLIDLEHDAALKGLTFAEAQRIAEIVPWLADCKAKRPGGPQATTALSFVAASMALEPA